MKIVESTSTRTVGMIQSADDPRDFLEWQSGSGGSVEITEIAVGSERGRGRGRALVAALLDGQDPSRLIYAITRETNTVAQEFYRALGFKTCGILRGFYDDGDAVMFSIRGRERTKV